MARDSFIFFRDWYEAAQSIEEGPGRLAFYDALAHYAFEGEKIPTPPEVAGYLFQPYKQIERGAEKAESTRKARSEARKLHSGNQYSRIKLEQVGTNGTSVPTMEQNGTNGTINKNKKDNKNIKLNNNPPTPPLGENEVAEGVFERIILTYRNVIQYMPLFDGRADAQQDGAKILRYMTDIETAVAVLNTITNFSKDRPLFELKQQLERMEEAGEIKPIGHKDWNAAAYINDTFSLLSLKKLKEALDSEEAWEVTKQCVADCRKGGIKFPDRYILAQLRELK